MGDVVAQELETMGPGMAAPAVLNDDGTPATRCAWPAEATEAGA